MMIGLLLAAVLLLAVFFIWQNNFPTVDEYAVESPALPPELDGCRVVLLSDLHNKLYGEDQKRLAAILESAEPDLILITGDLIDKRRTKEDGWGAALSLVRQAAELAPVFYVSGNHEWESGLYEKLRPQLETLGAEVLDNGFTVLDHGDAAMAVMGLSDPAAFSKSVKAGRPMQKEELAACAGKVKARLEWLCGQQEDSAFQVLLAHRPQLLDLYAEAGVHLVFCGHAHGGQVRLPWIGALFAPDQGWRPQYTEGPYIQDNTVMIVSRGLGNSACPFRVFDRTQVVAVTLKAAEAVEEAETEIMEDPETDESETMEIQAEHTGSDEPMVDALGMGLAGSEQEVPFGEEDALGLGLPEAAEEAPFGEEEALDLDTGSPEPAQEAPFGEEEGLDSELPEPAEESPLGETEEPEAAEEAGTAEEAGPLPESAQEEPAQILEEADGPDVPEPEEPQNPEEPEAEEAPGEEPSAARSVEGFRQDEISEEDEAAFQRLLSGEFPAMDELPEEAEEEEPAAN